MLDSGSTSDKIQSSAPLQWKVLIYDSFCKDVLAPLVKVGHLRDKGVTLYLDLHGQREAIPDVVAVYFVKPTHDNLKRIVADGRAGLYDALQLHFVTPIAPAALDSLAADAVAAGCVPLIEAVYDQYCAFVALEDSLFTLYHSDSYRRLNAAGVADSEIEAYVDSVVDGLFAVCATLSAIPIIRAPANGPAAMVAQRLDARIRDARMAGLALFEQVTVTESAILGSFERPLLVLTDRTVDMAVMLQHSWTYQTLVDDTLEYSLNRVRLTPPGGSGPTSYELDPAADEFWGEHAATPFPQIGDLVEDMVAKYAAVMDRVKSLKAQAAGDAGPSDGTALVGETRDLAANLNDHSRTKQLIDVHTSLATALLSEIEDRALDTFFFAEESILQGEKTDIASLEEILLTKGTLADKLRLFLIWFWATPKVKIEDETRLSDALTGLGVDIAALKHLKQMKSFMRMSPAARASASASASSTKLSWGQLLKSGKTLLKMTGVENWLPSDNHLPLTRLVAALLDGPKAGSSAAAKDAANYLLLDPKSSARAAAAGSAPTSFSHAIVFVVGGGNYIEYQNLSEYAKKVSSSPGRSLTVTYGTTQLIGAEAFCDQLTFLGQQG
ncbi:Sec1 family domain-containing protein 1 [Thecamonas trahens ATCC 50062]|uniref:Sec1 family domain-containing protein 1 n=1 Tax=Thecamonas trahens ATCC 50062 TaxID=461836 RepID=A0A0L0DSI9_THETB|nr:Sec1 family domain-containing protein 1 [Thecamonas trahens ATCC 50062]KNC54418.1 Sec1 family domain-containing protein 1 [Thecamonas trahens ATCC 50062]|eukprot:XP_013753714.1 Sec1 family domain-containing protein 1 [Thecamonas trahens ATCC 50062]